MPRRTRSVLEPLLEEIREAVVELQGSGEPLVEPRGGAATALASTALVSFTNSLALSLAALAASAPVLAVACTGRLPGKLTPRRIAVLLGYPAGLGLFAVLLSLLMPSRFWSSVVLLARGVAAAAVLLAWTSLLGWRGLLVGLRGLGLPGVIVDGLERITYLIPRFASMLVSMIAAREARTLGELPLRERWRVEATAVGDLLLRAMDAAWRQGLAIEARRLG